MRVKCIYMPNCVLAEGCVWNRNENVLYFTDIEGCKIYQLQMSDGSVTMTQTKERVGCLVSAKQGGILVAQTNKLVHWIGGEEQLLLTQEFPSYLRYNDGKCDRYGNLWIGTMAIDQKHPMASGGGSLFCIGNGQVKAEYKGYTIPNGLAWSPNGGTFYHIDTPLRQIDAYDVVNQHQLNNRRAVIRTAPEEGSPDGMCMDEHGNLWVAMWGGGRVNCYDTRTGKKLEEVLVPDTRVTCCCFGGENGKQLFITTARDENGNGGQIYSAEVGVGGTEVYRYGGEEDGV